MLEAGERFQEVEVERIEGVGMGGEDSLAPGYGAGEGLEVGGRPPPAPGSHCARMFR